MKYRLLILFFGLSLVGLSLGTTGTWAGANISGTWEFTVSMENGPTVNLTFVLKQDGEKLTGARTGGSGEEKVTGTGEVLRSDPAGGLFQDRIVP